jgi:hypothetical protein
MVSIPGAVRRTALGNRRLVKQMKVSRTNGRRAGELFRDPSNRSAFWYLTVGSETADPDVRNSRNW